MKTLVIELATLIVLLLSIFLLCKGIWKHIIAQVNYTYSSYDKKIEQRNGTILFCAGVLFGTFGIIIKLLL